MCACVQNSNSLTPVNSESETQGTAGTAYLFSTVPVHFSWEDLHGSGDSTATSCKCPEASSLAGTYATGSFTHIWRPGRGDWKILLRQAVDRSTYRWTPHGNPGSPQPGSLEVPKVRVSAKSPTRSRKPLSDAHPPREAPFPWKQMCSLSFELS